MSKSCTYQTVTTFNSKSPVELSVFSDDELANYYNHLIYLLDTAKYQDVLKQYEIEIAYVQREKQIRLSRYEAHQKYLSNIQWYEKEDDNYPEFDQTSNNEFIYLDNLRNDLQQTKRFYLS